MRNPKDIMVSSYYFHQMAGFLEDPGTFDEFMDKFLEGKGQRSHMHKRRHARKSIFASSITIVVGSVTGQPMSASFAVMFGKWTDHVKSWRNSELGDRIMYITYEEMVQVKHLKIFLLTTSSIVFHERKA